MSTCECRTTPPSWMELARRTAAENEALRAENKRLREMQRTVLVEQGEDVARLRAENERLRAALEETKHE